VVTLDIDDEDSDIQSTHDEITADRCSDDGNDAMPSPAVADEPENDTAVAAESCELHLECETAAADEPEDDHAVAAESCEFECDTAVTGKRCEPESDTATSNIKPHQSDFDPLAIADKDTEMSQIPIVMMGTTITDSCIRYVFL
jgi:hypothetical protein